MLDTKLLQQNVGTGGILNAIALLLILKSDQSKVEKNINLTESLLLLDINKYGYILKEANLSIDNIIKYAISS